MSKIRILIVEDELLISESIRLTLNEAGYEEIIVTDNGEDALKILKKDQPDLVFMDIALAGKDDGIETTRKMRTLSELPVIFLSQLHDEKTIAQLTRFNQIYYLPKPFTPPQLHAKIQFVLHDLEARPDAVSDNLFLKDANGVYYRHHISDILYIAADGAYCTIHFSNGSELVQARNMREMTERISHPKLLRVHRSYTVNTECIDAVKGNTLVIKNKEIPVSAEHRDQVMNRLNIIR